jgi:hypothetical protein
MAGSIQLPFDCECMNCLIIFLQIGELFEGKFNWRGLFLLFLFLLMGLIVVGFSALFIFKAFSSKNKNDV